MNLKEVKHEKCTRKSFSKIGDFVEMPNLIQVQKDSYNWFIEEGLGEVLKDISIQFRENEFVAIMGSSGCGKTTLLNLLGGLENPTHGCVYINDVDITQLSMEERSSFRRWHIGFIFQNFNLIPEMNVFENIVLPAKLMERNISKKEVMRIAEELEIEEKLLQNPMTLSGGQQQRVAIARAIYTHPTILLGDELTGNLDSTTSISVMKFLKKMCKKYSQTMIIVTHDERIAAMADRIIQMKDGRVV